MVDWDKTLNTGFSRRCKISFLMISAWEQCVVFEGCRWAGKRKTARKKNGKLKCTKED